MKELFERYCGMRRVGPNGRVYETQTQKILIEKGVGSQIADLSEPYWGSRPGPIALVYDDNTFLAAGQEVESCFGASKRETYSIRLQPRKNREMVVCDDQTLSEVAARLSDGGAIGAIGVGSGTISDLVKMSTHRLSIPCVTVGTAPSNNGYTSAIAAILSKGVKTTQPCTPSLAIFADPEVFRNAPYRMIASGIGDLYSKPVSNADWRLSYRLLGSFYSPIVMEIVDAGSGLLDGVAEKLPERDLDAVTQLTGAIMLSGLAMQAAGSSGPASGGEHLVSHFLDMTADIDGEPHDFHGCQVAVGTIVTAKFYDRLRRIDRSSIDIDRCLSRWVPWDTYANVVSGRFGDLSASVLEQARLGYPDRDVLAARLTKLKSEWDEIIDFVSETLRPPQDLESELDDADCPVRFDQIGVSHARALRAVRHCKDIRNRYTILHLAWELGLLDEWAEEVVVRVGC